MAVCLLNRWIKSDSYGDDVYDEPVALSCYKEEKISIVKNMDGEEVVSTHILYLDGILEMDGQDTITIDDDTRPIQAFSRFPGLQLGKGTTVVYL